MSERTHDPYRAGATGDRASGSGRSVVEERPDETLECLRGSPTDASS